MWHPIHDVTDTRSFLEQTWRQCYIQAKDAAHGGKFLADCRPEQDEDQGKDSAVVEMDHELVKYMFPDAGAHVLE